ncbi:MAG: PTS lactose/cellobiose transporter subunit IIA [Mycoplasmatales bacterium]|nr:PTS lactose/cellobiose transporter subunit IIA [Mycoplasmatales bacterium]
MDKNKKVDWERISFEIITKAGTGKSQGMEALYKAKEGKFDEASELLKEANKSVSEASHTHMDIVVAEAQGIQHDFKVLFIHAEDQLLTTQTLLLVLEELIQVYKKIS